MISRSVRFFAVLAVAFLLGAFLAALLPSPALAQDFDIVIRGGRILDGSGNPAFNADVGIRGEEIVRVGDLSNVSAGRVIDATGLYVVPGFIDMHSHADGAFASDDVERRKAHNLVMQGITTVVFGPDGRNPMWPIADEMEAYRTPGVAMNVVPMVGHGTVRGLVMGDDYERAATEAEILEMQELVRSGMEDGAWGLGAGPEYRPGRFSTTEELIALAEVVADYDGFYYSHQRSQSPLPLWQTPSMVEGEVPLTGTDGMKETIRIGRETGIRVVGSHIKAKGTDMWGQSALDVLRIDRARAEGVQVYLDQYPYETFGGGPTDIIPVWVYAPPGSDRSGGLDAPGWRRLTSASAENLTRNLADPAIREDLIGDSEYLLRMKGGADRLVIVRSPSDPDLVGQTLAEVADANGVEPIEQLIRFALDAGEPIPSGVLFRPIAGHAEDVERYMRQDYTATSTDGGVSGFTRPGQHPRYYGAFVRKLAYYVKEQGVISLPFAVRSSSGLPAQIVGLSDRGYVREGFKADITIFDYERLDDRATILEPDLYPEGMEYVLVNGVLTLDQGALTGALPGTVLDRREVRGR
jgi:N-acyl-D-amino-acid deacylase